MKILELIWILLFHLIVEGFTVVTWICKWVWTEIKFLKRSTLIAPVIVVTALSLLLYM